MSRWSTDVIALGLGGTEAALARGFSGKPPLEASPAPGMGSAGMRLVPMADDACLTEAGAIAALSEALTQAVGEGKARPRQARQHARLVLDDFWTHHAILRGDFRAFHRDEALKMASAYFSELAEETGENALAVRAVVQPSGRSLYACAMSRSLLDGLASAASLQHVTLDSVRMALPETLDRLNREIRGKRAHVLIYGQHFIHGLTRAGASWEACDSQRVFAEANASPAAQAGISLMLLDRLGHDKEPSTPVYLCGPKPWADALLAELPQAKHLQKAWYRAAQLTELAQ